MARIIVTPDEQSDVVLLDEHVYPVHLDNQRSSLQMAERLAWAVNDAEATERRERRHVRDSERDVRDSEQDRMHSEQSGRHSEQTIHA